MTKKKTSEKKTPKVTHISTTEIAAKHGKEKSYVNKLIKRLKLKTVKGTRSVENGGDGKTVNCLTMAEYKKLVDYPGFVAPKMGKGDMLVQDIADKLGVDLKTVRTIAAKFGYEFQIKNAGKGKSRKTLTKAQAAKIIKSRSDRVEL